PGQQAFTYAEPVSINQYGLRGPELQNRDEIDLRVICLGDSITFGVGVPDEVPFPRQLEARLSEHDPALGVEVINAGVQRYFTYQEIDWLRSRGLPLRPDIVILACYYNDLGLRPTGEYVREFENQREQAATSLRNHLPWLYLAAKNSALVELAKQAWLTSKKRKSYLSRVDAHLTAREEREWKALEDELASFRRLAESEGFVPIVVTIPARIQVQQNLFSGPFPRRVLEICRRLGVRAVDTSPLLVRSLEEGADPYLPWDNHLSEIGHRIVAARLFDVVESVRLGQQDEGSGFAGKGERRPEPTPLNERAIR
ncbi:MAG: hypothetical protein D6815_12135, partial [Candidatus Dadabacteria bacterium]